jgi:nicotinate dehydrogenase subunit A
MTILTLNGEPRRIDTDPGTPLLYVLRNELHLNGAKYGCGLGQCGACTVLLDGQAVFSCLTPLAATEGRKVRTIEALGTEETPSVLQKAFIDEQAAQCGYCTAGMVMRAQALLEANPHPSDAEIRMHMQPNLCRCGTQMRVIRAIKRAATALGSAER